MTVTGECAHRYLVHDRDGIFAPAVDAAIASMGLRVLKTPVRTPHAFCERLIGTIRRECLDWVIPLNERHLRQILTEWIAHDHRGRPHTSLGPACQKRHRRQTGRSRPDITSRTGTASR